jgi:tripartite ATP-independent transporter DctP family solute receptor
MNKKIIFTLTALLTFIFISCGKSNKQETEIWKLAFNQSMNHPQAKVLLWLSDEFYKVTDGSYRIEIDSNELLGNQKETFEALQRGTIQMAIVGNGIVEVINDDFAVLSLPNIYRDIEHQELVYKSNILNDLFKSTIKENFYTLAAIHAGIRNIYAKKPIHTLDDLKGLKIRVQESPSMIELLNSMGAIAVPMPQGEVYAAIQQGLIDGAENNEVLYTDLKHYEVAPVYSYTKHIMLPDLLIINNDAYESLSPEHKIIFDRLIKEFKDRVFELFIKQIEISKKEAISKGASFIDDFDNSVFNKKFNTIIERTLNTPNKKQLFNSIKEIK